MRRSSIALALSFVLATVAAEAINLDPMGVSASVGESCGLPDLTATEAGRTTRSVTITNQRGLQQMLQRAITTAGPAPVVNVNLVNTEDVHMNSDGVASTRTSWVNSCTPTPGSWCFNSTQPANGDWVRVTVTLTNGATRTRFYGDLSAGVTTSASSVFAMFNNRMTYTQSFAHAFTYEELTNGFTDVGGNPIPRCDVASVFIEVSAAHNLSALCTVGPPTATARARVAMDPAGLNNVGWVSMAATCP